MDAATQAVIDDQANWARTFAASDTPGTSLAQRHAGWIAQKQSANDAAEAANFEQQVMRDRDMQAYVFGKERLEMAKAKHGFEMEKAAELAPLQIAAEAQQVRTAAALERARTADILHKQQLEEERANDMSSFIDEVSTSPHKLGTREHQAFVAQSILKHPAADNAFLDNYWKTTAPDPALTPQQVVEQFNALKGNVPDNTALTVDARGARVTTTRPPQAADDTAKRLAHLEGLRARPNLDEDQKAYFDSEITSIKNGKTTNPSPSVPGGASTAADKFIVGKQYRDGAGNVAVYRGDGKWE